MNERHTEVTRAEPMPKGTSKNALVVTIIILAVALAVALALMATAMASDKQNKGSVENMYKRAYYDTAANMDNIEVKLSKLLVASSATQRAVLAEGIWRQSSETANTLSMMPINHHSVENTMKFVNQLGEYTHALANRLANGAALTDTDEEMLEKLYDSAVAVNNSLKEFGDKINSGEKISDHIGQEKIYAGTGLPSEDMLDNEHQSIEYPRLIYDGPFSDSLDEKDYKLINKLPISQVEDAKAWVTKRFPGAKNISHLGMTEGKLIMHQLQFDMQNNRGIYLQLTEQGLVPVVMSAERNIKAATVDEETAISNAEDFAKTMTDTELKSVWYNESDGIAYINVVPVLDGVIYYPDLIKIKIALDNGQPIGFESTAYLINHTSRMGVKAGMSQSAARGLVSKKLNVTSAKKAVIPKDNGKEVFCYEFSGEYKGYTYIVYINAETGAEESILRVINNDQGKLTE